MDETQQKALLVYVAVVLGAGYFGHTNFAGPEKIRRNALQKDVAELKTKKDAFLAAKKQSEEETAKLAGVKSTLDAILLRFPKPKGRQGERQIKFYDTFTISEEVSSAAHGLVLNPKESLDAEHFLYQSLHVQEEDLVAKGDTMMDSTNKATLKDEERKISPFLNVDQVRFRYQISGDFKSFVAFLEGLNDQPAYLDATSLDVSQKGLSGTAVSANVIVSCLDLSDGLGTPSTP